MAKLRLEQILSNLTYNAVSGVLTASGSVDIVQTDPLSPALTAAGAVFIEDAANIASASFNTSGSINIEILDGGFY